jgi:hypothetical protein
MNRLTKRNEDIVYYVKGKYEPKTLSADMEPWEVRECMQKLAAYEDTGLEPEDVLTSDELREINIKLGELIDYINLEEQGLLIKLPCKVGTKVFEICTHCGWYAMDIPTTYSIQERVFNYEYINDIGKTIFLTREEAEKALEGLK